MTLLLANSLSPLMWRTALLLLVGNALLGFVEGAIVARVFRFPSIRTILLFIVANYASMGVGIALFGIGEGRSPIPDNLFDVPLHHASAILWICLSLSFIISLIVEWPFAWLASRMAKSTLRRSILAVLLANGVTYPLLILLFSDTTNTIGDEVQLATLDEVVPDSLDAMIYFIGEDGSVYSMRLDGTDRALVRRALLTDQYDVLGWHPPGFKSSSNTWRLMVDSLRDEGELMERPAGRCAAFVSEFGSVQTGGWWLGTVGVADLRVPDDRDWKCTPRVNRGIVVTRDAPRETFTITYDTPFVSWFGRCITILPGDLAVFELGRQICVLSMPDRRIAFLARGQGPVVLLAEDRTETP